MLVLAAPVAAVAAVVGWTFGGFLTSGPQFALLSAPEWAALVLVPVLALAAGLALVGRYERMLRRVWQDGAASSADS